MRYCLGWFVMYTVLVSFLLHCTVLRITGMFLVC